MSEEATDDFAEFPSFPAETPRERLLQALREELLGPSDEEEQLDGSPNSRYLVGVLSPRGVQIDEAEDEQDLAHGEDEEAGGGQVNLSNSLDPSSIGLSVIVDENAQSISVTATWGDYFRIRADAEPEEASAEIDEESEPLSEQPESAEDLLDTEPSTSEERDDESLGASRVGLNAKWQRSPRELSLTISLQDQEDSGASEPDAHTEHGVGVRYLVRRTPNGQRMVSIFLENRREREPGRRPPPEQLMYQPQIVVQAEDEVFASRGWEQYGLDPDPDIQSAELLYRNRHEFGVGHGVAVDWEKDSSGRTSRVWTEIIPAHEVAKINPKPSISMDDLGSGSVDETIERLRSLTDDYGNWLEARREEADSIDEPLGRVANVHLELGRRSLERMRSGIEALRDKAALEAFQFTNRVMALQRRRSVQVLQRQQGEQVTPDEEIKAEWRAFQLGFILQNLKGLVEPDHEDRSTADLLWFPTGGGKTEAYLGLTAFVFAYRRLKPKAGFEPNAGVAVIMRYTLRLLTIQQFQRALTLTAACEYERRKNEDLWGSERFTIGLWVGQSATPNSYDDAKRALEKLKSGQPVYEKSPYQLLYCPWCGEDFEPRYYRADDDQQRIRIFCWNLECDFNAQASADEGLPAMLVDEEIYRHPPSLLLATVDKFAQMAFNGKIQSLFGRVERHCPRHGWLSAAEQKHPNSHEPGPSDDGRVVVRQVDRMLTPPDLIIQDELHLISGPLGTVTGTYEAVIDSLCSVDVDGEKIRPKVVASTATVRRADRQVKRLFNRPLAVFPPQGLRIEDSFFGEETKDEPGRLYVGVFGPGKSIKTTLVRTYSALLGRGKYEHEMQPGDETDAYMSLVGYFNSLRELGGTVRLVEDDVPKRLRHLKRRGFSPDRLLYEVPELTSRKASSDISRVLGKLNRTHAELESGAYPVDVLLASNMISVGVDIDRLGLMVVSGQPKTTAEYIQATSRVGRRFPGLVVCIYNWSRPRDISHYETFHHYHSTFYRHVEATSVTPFSERARDRSFPAVLAAHSRMSQPKYSNEGDANKFDRQDSVVEEFENFLIDRARKVARHGEEVAQESAQQLGRLLFDWDRYANEETPLVYSSQGQDKEKTKAVLLGRMENENSKGIWEAAGSLREVEDELDIVIKQYRDEGE